MYDMGRVIIQISYSVHCLRHLSFFGSQAGGPDWISLEVLAFHFSQASTFLFPLQFCPLGLRLWHCQSVGIIPQKAGKVRCRDEQRLFSSIPLCIAVCAVDRAMEAVLWFLILLSLSPSDARVGSCIVTLNLLILSHWLVGHSSIKDIPHELIGARQCLWLSVRHSLEHLH